MSRVAVADFLPTGGGVYAPPPPPVAKRASRLPSLTGLRFLAAVLVLACHASSPTLGLFADVGVADGVRHATALAGELAIGFFFLLSGFVLTWSARRGDRAGAFWRRRVVTIYPSCVVAGVLALVLSANGYRPWHAVTNIGVDSPWWSLGMATLCYAVFPPLLVFARRIRPERLRYWLGGLGALVIATSALTDLLPPLRVLDFALGVLVARAVMTGRWRDIGMTASGLLLAGAYVLAETVPHLYGQRALFVITSALVIAATAIADTEGRFTLFSSRAMSWLGELSFAFCLTHVIVLAYGRSLLGDRYFSTSTTIVLLIGGVVVSIAASWALYLVVERPSAHRWSTAGTRLRGGEALH